MNNFFTELQEVKANQEKALQRVTPLSRREDRPPERDAQKVAQKTAQLSKGMSKPLSKKMSNAITQDAVEELAFQLRKTTARAKLNTTIPLEWKEKFDDLAFRLKVGKYELLTYIVGVFLGEVEQPEP